MAMSAMRDSYPAKLELSGSLRRGLRTQGGEVKRLCEVCTSYFYQPYGVMMGHIFLCTSTACREWRDVPMTEPERCPEYKGRKGVDELREAGRLMKGEQ